VWTREAARGILLQITPNFTHSHFKLFAAIAALTYGVVSIPGRRAAAEE